MEKSKELLDQQKATAEVCEEQKLALEVFGHQKPAVEVCEELITAVEVCGELIPAVEVCEQQKPVTEVCEQQKCRATEVSSNRRVPLFVAKKCKCVQDDVAEKISDPMDECGEELPGRVRTSSTSQKLLLQAYESHVTKSRALLREAGEILAELQGALSSLIEAQDNREDSELQQVDRLTENSESPEIGNGASSLTTTSTEQESVPVDDPFEESAKESSSL